MKRVCLIALLCICATTSMATDAEKPRNTVLYGVGYTNQYDSYLSPLEFSGVQLDLLYCRDRLINAKHATKGQTKHNNGQTKHVSCQSLLNLQLHTGTPKTNFPRLYGADIHYDAGWFYNWWNVGAPRLDLKLGGQVGATIGGVYANRSSNNPANAHAAVRTSLSAGAKYTLPLKRTQLTFRYQADLPLIGAAFSPDYGQSYYEMWKHGYSDNICLSSAFKAFSLRQLALVDIRLRRSTIIVGYKADLRQAKLNNLRQHQYAHSFMIGWKKGF